MAIETIDFDGCITVTTHTEVILGRRDATCLLAGMAIDTLFKTVLLGADALMNGFVPMTVQNLHVIPPHIFGGLHTLLTF